MIINKRTFINEIDLAFWNKATKNVAFKDVIRYKDIRRSSYLSTLCDQINDFDYNFLKPNYYYFPKGNGVLRKVKSYLISDIAIYYFCVKLLQDKLYERVSENERIFGSFKFTSANSTQTINITMESDGYESFLDKESFAFEWKEFQNLAKDVAKKRFDKYVHIDISHFYDDINLDILEREIRNIVNDQSDVIDLLFYFLRYSDKRDLRYSPNNVGIPQEEIGDMSRVLANFYLAPFDSEILNYLNATFEPNDYVYMRYSDDMWFCFNGDDLDAHKLIQQVSLSLGKLKLHINEGKTDILQRKDYVKHWYFKRWNDIQKNWNNPAFIKNMYQKIIKGNKSGRWVSIARYLFKMIASSPSKFLGLYSETDAEQLLNSLLEHPILVENLEKKHSLFLVSLIKKYTSSINVLKDYLVNKGNIYPNVEYFVLQLFMLIPNNPSTNIMDYICDFYLNHTNTKDYHWYSRTICIKFFMRPPSMNYLTSSHKNIYKKIIEQISQNSHSDNSIERRYMIYFLYKYGKIKGKKVLREKFNNQSDLKFIKYLQER